jgi:DNA-binding MarR family transcriptional regulator
MDTEKCPFDKENEFEKVKPLWVEKIRELSGSETINGVELGRMIKIISNLYDMIFALTIKGAEISGPRFGILMGLYVNEKIGRTHGINPTFLSKMQNVNKNTISSLISGLEDQGLIYREIDPEDRRAFRIMLTDAGRILTTKQAPKYIEYMNITASGLSLEEQAQLLSLLKKLMDSLRSNIESPRQTSNP